MKKFILDEIDHQILDILIENARTPFTDIAKQLLVSAGTIHVRVKKMEDEGIIQGSTLTLNYEKMGYSFIAHVGVFLEKTSMTQSVIENLRKIPNVTVAYVTAGKYNIFCKIDDIPGVNRTETMIALEESINDKKRMMHAIFAEL
jgi:Lrp/AsnC family transcriptional regulator for asnA, asnC and gidA